MMRLKTCIDHYMAAVLTCHAHLILARLLFRVVYITGAKDAVEVARNLIAAKVGGRYLEPKDSQTMHVPTQAVMVLLGEKGKGLAAIYEASGAKVYVSPAAELEMGSTETKVKLQGPPDALEAARKIITEKVAKWMSEHVSPNI